MLTHEAWFHRLDKKYVYVIILIFILQIFIYNE